MDFDIRLDTRGARLSLAMLSDNQARASINRALNRAAASTSKKAVSLIRGELNLKGSAKSGTFGGTKLISVTKASGGSLTNQEARVTIAAKGAPLTDFKGTRETNRGLSVQIYKGRARKVLKSRFIYPGKHGGISAERMRVGDTRVPRGPIKLLFGPGPAQFAAKPRIRDELIRHAGDRGAIELERDVAFRLAKGVSDRRGKQPDT